MSDGSPWRPGGTNDYAMRVMDQVRGMRKAWQNIGIALRELATCQKWWGTRA